MNEVLNAVIGISIIFLATTIGSSTVFLFKKGFSDKVSKILIGFSSGVMLSASFFSLLLPAIEQEVNYMPSWIVVGLGTLLGAGFLWLIDHITPHLHAEQNKEEGPKTEKISKTTKMFLAVTIHNIPEGLAVGIAYGVAFATQGEARIAAFAGALLLSIGIAIQNIPEGAVVSLPVASEENKKFKGFLFGTFSGVVEPISAVIGLFLAFLIKEIMPWALSFAAGAMLYVIAEEMIPDMKSNDPTDHIGVWSMMIGFVLMMILDVALG